MTYVGVPSEQDRKCRKCANEKGILAFETRKVPVHRGNIVERKRIYRRMVKRDYKETWCATTGWLQKLDMCVEIAKTHQCDPESIKDEMLWMAWEAQKKADKDRERRKRKGRGMERGLKEEEESEGTSSQDEKQSSGREDDHEDYEASGHMQRKGYRSVACECGKWLARRRWLRRNSYQCKCCGEDFHFTKFPEAINSPERGGCKTWRKWQEQMHAEEAMSEDAKEKQDEARDEVESAVEKVLKSEEDIVTCIQQIVQLKAEFVRRSAESEEAEEVREKGEAKMRTEERQQVREAFAEAVALSKSRADSELDAEGNRETLDEMGKVHKELHDQLEHLLASASEVAAKRKEAEREGQRVRARIANGEEDNEEGDTTEKESRRPKGMLSAGQSADAREWGHEKKCKRRRFGRKASYEEEWICAIYG